MDVVILTQLREIIREPLQERRGNNVTVMRREVGLTYLKVMSTRHHPYDVELAQNWRATVIKNKTHIDTLKQNSD